MQESHINQIAMGEWLEQLGNVKKTQNVGTSYQYMAQKIADETDNLPEGARTPTTEEVMAMDKWAEEYRSKNPKASPRNVRRAMQRKFNIQVLPNTNK